ncbi:MAG: sulfatase [Myxococcales bacterium]|nr:sulfatase [Myxococcales bacterium]
MGRWSSLGLLLVAVVFSCNGNGGADKVGGGKGGKGGKTEAPGEPSAIAAAAPSGSGSVAVTGKGRPDGKARPNILFVLADDQRADTLACMPKLGKLLARGTTFKNNFASTPLCCPGRSSILTGKYAHNHGVLSNGDIEDEDGSKSPGAIDFRKNGNEAKTFAGWLQQKGYRTGYFGKYLNAYDKILETEPMHIPPHWDEWRAFSHAEYFDFDLMERGLGETKATRRCYLSNEAEEDRDRKGNHKGTGSAAEKSDSEENAKGKKKGKKKERKCKGVADEVVRNGKENYSTDVLRDQVIGFIRKVTQEGKPWIAHFAPKAPHGPFLSPARYQPDPEEASFSKEALDRLSSCALFDWKGRPPSYLEADMTDKPQWIQESKSKRTAEDRLDRVRHMQLASVLATEDAVEEILKVLGELGVADETVIVYTGDNGFAWGEHWHTHKNCAYEECIRVPLVVVDPRAAGGPRTVDDFTMNVDLAPTFAAWAGASVPEKVDGLSFAGLVDGSAKGPWPRTEVLSECWGPGTAGRPDTHAAVRTKKWKYIEHYADDARTKLRVHDGSPERELYDLEKDPFEVDNLLRLSPANLARTGHTKDFVDTTTADLAAKLRALEAK